MEYPEIEEGTKPRHRFMSAFEQRVETADKTFQYLLFAAEPYEVISFKVPNAEVDGSKEHFFTHWDPDAKVFSLQMRYRHAAGERAWQHLAARQPAVRACCLCLLSVLDN